MPAARWCGWARRFSAGVAEALGHRQTLRLRLGLQTLHARRLRQRLQRSRLKVQARILCHQVGLQFTNRQRC